MAGPQINDARLSLEIRTKSVEQTLIPLVTQVGPFVGFILAFSKQTMVFFIVYHFFQSDFGLMHLLQYRPRMPRLEFFCLSRVFFLLLLLPCTCMEHIYIRLSRKLSVNQLCYPIPGR